jgi:hypothetical protein
MNKILIFLIEHIELTGCAALIGLLYLMKCV